MLHSATSARGNVLKEHIIYPPEKKMRKEMQEHLKGDGLPPEIRKMKNM